MYSTSVILSGAITCVMSVRYASAIDPDECLASIQHPPVTVTEVDGMYTQCYTSTYTQLGSDGLHKETYTIFETCSEPICRFPLETAPPPGFTTGVVHCKTCNSGGPLETTLTFPSASLEVYFSTAPTGAPNNATTPTPSHNATALYTPPASSPFSIVQAAGQTLKPSVAGGLAVSLLSLVSWAL
ncbi:hypothetical protein CC79DRAFT_565941 [Sarocladium strictum]